MTVSHKKVILPKDPSHIVLQLSTIHNRWLGFVLNEHSTFQQFHIRSEVIKK
ncbi:unnamed protein product [Schistosoma mattheei]|uniref:Uncharacterized protein n=1 Tax=Schistosoma mattheei TaxID=31246 RepID=A0A183NMU3_9TREM|nr:unnamed protein product [Schistosoma mattheei]